MNNCPNCGVTVTDQTPSALYLEHDETCGGDLNEPESDEFYTGCTEDCPLDCQADHRGEQ